MSLKKAGGILRFNTLRFNRLILIPAEEGNQVCGFADAEYQHPTAIYHIL
jgi:hypothetical protein